MTGNTEPDLWYSNRQLIDFYDIKGLVENVLNKISLDNTEFISYDNFIVDDYACGIYSDDRLIGYFGLLKESLQSYYDVETPVFIVNFNVERLFDLSRREKIYKPVPRFPWVERDLAFIVDEKMEVEDLISTIKAQNIKFLKDISVFDVYKGKQVKTGEKSIALRFIFQAMDRSLVEEEVSEIIEGVINIIQKKFKIKFRPS